MWILEFLKTLAEFEAFRYVSFDFPSLVLGLLIITLVPAIKDLNICLRLHLPSQVPLQ